ncbi:RAM signaling network component [Neophaeococcomyces mojaviensis]|uniref:RAM signaling network component n=1 Tax=Neophaeococcomyces mojaviensis TaxID=3383035 RepID=A0ACC3AEY2_9EURO|nr:RAM signaling network component [Knufia sp. JES_112]
MDIEQSLQARGIPTPDDRTRLPKPFRREAHDLHRQHYDTHFSSDHGPGPATFENTPPGISTRSRSRLTPHTPGKTAQEKPDCISLEQTIELFKRKIEDARKETQHVLADTPEVPSPIKQTLTIDLGRERIERLPDAVIDLILADVERLSLSHNFLRYMPVRTAECKQLRYLNIRSNDFKEIPPPVFQMPLLEILDVSKNKINTIPPEIKQLESLRVFSIVHNRLVDLPLELTDMPRLKVFKVADNPFREGIKKVLQAKETEVAYSEMLENEKDTALTTELLIYLRSLKPLPNGTPTAHFASSNESVVESTRPTKRALSGRFPVVPAAILYEAMPESIENRAQLIKPPSLPAKSHLRGMSSQVNQGGALRRPGIAPVVVNGNERNRSNSESVIQASAAARQKRMGMVRGGRTELDSIDETKVARNSHLRGFSHGSALRRQGSISSPSAASSSPSSPKDVRKERAQFVRRLSSLPEYRTDPDARRPLIEGAKGILYALYQVHPLISGLISASKGRDARRSALEMSFYNASVHVDKLNKSLHHADSIDPEDDESWDRAEEMINNDCATCIKGFVHVTTQMQDCTSKIVAELDPRYIRSLMLLLYGSMVEIKNAIKSFGIETRYDRRQMSSGQTYGIQTIPEEPSRMPETPQKQQIYSQDADGMTLRQQTRSRSETVLQHPGQGGPSLQPVQPPTLQIPNNINVIGSSVTASYSRASSAGGNASNKSFAARSRSNSRSTPWTMQSEPQNSTVTITPHSTDQNYHLRPTASFNGRPSSATGMADAQEDNCFEQIFLALTKSYESALQAIPVTMQQFQRCLDAAAAAEQRQPKEIRQLWSALVQRSRTCLDLTQALQLRLTHMKPKDLGVGHNSSGGGRHDPSFWQLSKAFLQSFVDLVTEIKEVRKLQLLILPQEIVAILRPVQKACRDAGHLINASPWNYLFSGVNVMPAPTPFEARGEDTSRSPHANRQAMTSNSNLTAYSAVTSQQQNSQAYQNHHPLAQKGVLQHPPFLSSLPTPSLPTPTSATMTNGASPLSAQLPATPLSAALGPAAQATVPSTPGSLYGDSFFKGDVFQRADSLLSMQQAGGTVNFLNRR